MFPYEGPGDSAGVQGEFMHWGVAKVILPHIKGGFNLSLGMLVNLLLTIARFLYAVVGMLTLRLIGQEYLLVQYLYQSNYIFASAILLTKTGDYYKNYLNV